ncbi:MAG: RHS repeat-associated core domain-containing protein [Spirochaetaceae bacterium]|nr:RHS repeat-associated core domain-containing protein [Spirochaetaceae bacterium]
MYLGTDILGSVRSSTNELGVLEDRYEYDAFGRPHKGDLESGMNRGYTGKPYDTRTGLYNYGYRDYAPATARFTTTDPVRDGNNWFAYVNNDPVNWVDPWGLSGSDGQNKPKNEIPPKTPGEKVADKVNETLEKVGEKTGITFSDKIGWTVGFIVDSFSGDKLLGNTGLGIHFKGSEILDSVTMGRFHGPIGMECKIIGGNTSLTVKLPFVNIIIHFNGNQR